MELGVCKSVSHMKSVELNPQLEALRLKGLQESASENNEWILQMINRTSHIHAGFLFEDLKTLQKLCLFIGETQNKISDAGWEKFGYHLGLNPSLLKVINYNNFNNEDPCYNILLSYVQFDNASIGKIIETLLVMGRIDVISRTKDLINDLADAVLSRQYNANTNDNSLLDTSDYESLPPSEGCSTNNNSTSGNEYFIKPKFIPPAPFIFQNLQANPELISLRIQNSLNREILSNSVLSFESETHNTGINMNTKISCFNNFNRNYEAQVINENLQKRSVTNERKEYPELSKKERYGLKILLTFAEDGEKYVEEICKSFRRRRDKYPSIGVLVLSEHARIVNKDPLQFISAAFCQVDYVCPVLTPDYFDLITKKQKAASLSNIHLDASFVPYIYRLMNSYFVSNDCLNDKIRCIIPDSVFSMVPLNILLTNPVFGAWVKLSEVDELAERLLKSALTNYL